MTTTHHHDHELHEHDMGLAYDLSTLARLREASDASSTFVRRRQALKLFAGAGLVALVGCGSSSSSSSGSTAGSSATTAGSSGTTAGSTATTAGSSATTAGATATTAGTTATTAGATTTAGASTADTSSAIPEETAGPYPGDGSNGPNALTQSGIVRSDIRTSLGSTTAVAGVPFTIELQIVKVGGAVYSGATVYLWHCDVSGNYSMYSQGATNETWLRGVQAADVNGNVSFTTIFPGCYDGRWPHVHFEVYPSLDKATAAGNKIATSQLALPEAPCKLVYATSGYSTSVSNLSRVTLATDNVFRDGATRETPTVTGDVSSGFVATLVVPVES